MNQDIIRQLAEITEEEKNILYQNQEIEKSRYTKKKDFIVDSKLMLERGKLMDIRPHTRFLTFPKHRHNYIEIVYMYSGKTVHKVNDVYEIHLNQGELLFLNKNSYHSILPAGEDDIAINFIVLPEFFDVAFRMMEEGNILRDFILGSLRQDTSQADYIHFKVADILPIQNLVENMIWSLLNHLPNNRQINQTTMGLLFMQLLGYTEKIDQSETDQFERRAVLTVLRYVEENYKDANLSELAETLNQPIYQLSKWIKNITGQTYKELLQTKRLNQAAYLLTTTKLAITDIINAVGYDNTSYFHRIFRERYDVTPREYREYENK